MLTIPVSIYTGTGSFFAQRIFPVQHIPCKCEIFMKHMSTLMLMSMESAFFSKSAKPVTVLGQGQGG